MDHLSTHNKLGRNQAESATEVQALETARDEEIAIGGLIVSVEGGKNEINDPEHGSIKAFPKYDLDSYEFEELQNRLVSEVNDVYPDEGLYVAIINPYHPYANLVRTSEAKLFPEVEDVSGDDEDNTTFLAFVDTRSAQQRIVHATTLTRANGSIAQNSNGEASMQDIQQTGFYTIDKLIELDNFSAEEFYGYYKARGVNIDGCIGVETNFRIGEKIDPFKGFSPAQLAYLTMFNLVARKKEEQELGGVFASINRVSVISFQRIGLECEPLMGRDGLTTPESELGQDYLPVFIPTSEQNRRLFKAMNANLPEINF
jgi:hypothetical protein